MQRNIFEFWSSLAEDAVVHPADAMVFARCPHRFERDCLPLPYFGPLRTAPVVLLFLSPGFVDPFDREHAATAAGRAYYAAQRSGRAPLPSCADHAPAHVWCRRVLGQFGMGVAEAATRLAVLNIGPYHSRSFHDYPMMTALPSCRVSLDWAQATLFPEAEKGERVVICLRAARLWGLSGGPGQEGRLLGAGLFVPRCTQGGIMQKGALREKAVAAVRERIGMGDSAGERLPAPRSTA